MRKSWALGVLVLLLSGCGSGDGDGDGSASTTIASGKLTGKVGGASWTLASAQTNAFLSDSDGLWVDLYAESVTTCGASGGGNSLILTVPMKVGSYPFGNTLNGTFVIASSNDNLVATNGLLRVDEVTSAMVRGGVSMTFNNDNSVSGDFEAVVCAN
jgi:hypothetical protein